jgi:hypothetical protein
MTDEPTETEVTVLHAFIRAMTDLTNTCRTEVPLEVLADALISGGVETLRKLYGPQVAAERLREAADLIEVRNPIERH